MTTLSLAQKSVAEPLTVPFLVCVQAAPGVSVKVEALEVPTFLMFTTLVTVWPGVIVVEPPNLLMVEQVAALESTPDVALVLRQVTVGAPVAPACDSCMTSEPEAAVLVSLVIEATKPDSVPDIETERRTAAATPPAMARGAKRTRLVLAAAAMWCDMV